MPEPSKHTIEVTGKSVDDAVQQALRRLNLSRPQVEVTVLAEGRAGIFGIGSNAARVRVTPRSSPAPAEPAGGPVAPLLKIADYADYAEKERETPAPARSGRARDGRRRDRDRDRDRNRESNRESEREREQSRAAAPPPPRTDQPFELLADPDYEPEDDPTQHAVNVLTDLLRLLGVEAKVSARPPETPMDGLDHAVAVLDVRRVGAEDDLGLLIGRRGQNLVALQYLLNLIVNRGMNGRHPFTVDIDSYKRQREDTLNALARRTAERVLESGQEIALEPMSAAERRIIHLALVDHPKLTTESAGEGAARRVQIVYREQQ